MNLKFFFTFLMIYAPLLFMYSSGIKGLTLLDISLLIFNIFFILNGVIKKKIKLKPIVYLSPLIIYLSFWVLISLNSQDTLMRALRYLFYISQIYLYFNTYFEYSLGIKLYRNMSIFASLYLYIQVIIRKFYNFYLPGVIPGIPLMEEELRAYSAQRPMSFFEEPSHFAIYILGYITILLFEKKKMTLKNFWIVSILSVSIFLSSSFLGIIVLFILILIKIIQSIIENIVKRKVNIKYIVIFLICILIGTLSLKNTKAFEYLSNVEVLLKQASGRFEGYYHYANLKSDIIQKIFGRGMIGMPDGLYYPSYILIIYYFGYIGLALFLFVILFNFRIKKFDKFSALIICLLGLGIGSELILGRFILLYYSIIAARNKE